MYKRVLIVVDPQPVSRAAIEEGLRLAAALGCEVTFFTMQPSYPMPIADAPFVNATAETEFNSAAKASADKLLAAARVSADKAGVMSHSMIGRGDDPAAAIIEGARHRRCDVIVVATEGRNALMRLLTGSVVPGLITASPFPVLVCQPSGADLDAGAKVSPGHRTSRAARQRAKGTTATAPAK